MEKLADTYGVPLYSLFNDAIPNLPPLPRDFRKSDPSPAALTPRGIKSLLLSERISQFAKQLAIELDYKPVELMPRARIATTMVQRATELRIAFDLWFEAHAAILDFSGLPEHRFMGALRLFFEVQGGVLNINSAPATDYMGFFLEPHAGFPTIFVNRSVSSRKAQLFTLAHELSHALLGADGISNPFAPANSIERACNVFAAEFLAPMDAFVRMVEALPRGTRSEVSRLIDAVASRTLLSKHAAGIRLLEADYLTRQQFEAWLAMFSTNPRTEKDEERDASEGGGGAPHAKRLSEIGYLPVFLAKRAIDSRLIDSFDVAEGIGLSVPLQERAYTLAIRRFEAASF
jgi:Zn-dependent peptidase ImmA (M78 family)